MYDIAARTSVLKKGQTTGEYCIKETLMRVRPILSVVSAMRRGKRSREKGRDDDKFSWVRSSVILHLCRRGETENGDSEVM